MTIRQAETHELATVLALFKETALKLQAKGINQWQHWREPTPQYIEWVQAGFDRKEYFFIEKSGVLAGMFRLMYTDEEYWGQQADSAAYVHSLAIKMGFEGQNIGSTVLQTIAQDLKEKGIDFLRLDCKADNEQLCNYYMRQGFQPIRKQEVTHYTVQLLEKKLNA